VSSFLTACEELPEDADLEQICIDVPQEPTGSCNISDYTIIREEIFRDPENGFYKDFEIVLCGNPDDLDQCFFVQWVKGYSRHRINDEQSPDEVHDDFELDMVENATSPEIRIGPLYMFGGEEFTVLERSSDTSWTFHDVPGWGAPLVEVYTYHFEIDLQFRLQAYNRGDPVFSDGVQPADFYDESNPSPAFVVEWSFEGEYFYPPPSF
jgi:hypothetical protein